ncbi:cytochrome c oxidase accessory protein CcoG [Flavobacterium stagni]|uniref:Cytochrome c oxidase accessory protein CcoG n=1 Tax=Flavobacterium stagni TaxID=2506421 RepID=A0A4Q1KA53_9FLAO|nr:cytochrome c oxidase accessory protein CcoG [Flavobacterium stagni]RXR23489.1 cytochrome c oxidase accessory protein CcoG [Flavobacterium stagni]
MASQLHDDSFRDTIATIDQKGKRAFIFPKKPSGPMYDRRKIVSYFLLVFLFGAPFVKINGHQFLLFNVLERRFNIFGFPFWPQDFHLFVISMIIGVVGLALFTVAFGRIFCGWFCPQTIFMEMVFRRIEYWIEGDRNQQIRLEKQEWDAEKIRKRVTKWIVFYVISFVIANVFLAYLKGSDTVIEFVKEGPTHNTSTLIAVLIFSAVFYFIYAWFREQVCIIACPYGRLQGVLLDNKTINVSYDHVRGEGENGRAKITKGEDRVAAGKGDCIDCKACIHVCPTGIDIRNGVQLECVNCTACIDECDTIMDKVGFPKGLIRYASEDEIVKKEKFKFTNRMKGYSAVLLILTGIFVGMLFLRSQVEATILKVPGQMFLKEGNRIVNVYNFKVVNKTNEAFQHVTFKLVDAEGGEIKLVGANAITVPGDSLGEGTLFIKLPESLLNDEKKVLHIEVYDGNRRIESTTTNFNGPRRFN